ncbi:MAG: PAS domain-containing protein [Planctomycetota bacterium]
MENTRYKILLIEDDKLDQTALARMVEEQELSYDCTMADSVAEAKDILSSSRFDIIIADYALGDGTAFDILDLVKDAPVILVTGAGDEETAVAAWKAGAYDYLIKDLERNYLKTLPITVENAVRHNRMDARLQLLSHALVSTDDSVYITDLEDKITFVNRAFCETYGYTEEEVLGKDCDVLWKENPSAANMEKAYKAVNGWEVGFFHKRKDGTEFPVSLSRSDVIDENGNEVALVVISRDISERMRVENELRIINQDLEKENRLKTELVVAACQQLMMPTAELKDIITNAMKGNLGEISTNLRNNLELAERNTNRLKEIISNFLDMSQIDAEKIEV